MGRTKGTPNPTAVWRSQAPTYSCFSPFSPFFQPHPCAGKVKEHRRCPPGAQDPQNWVKKRQKKSEKTAEELAATGDSEDMALQECGDGELGMPRAQTAPRILLGTGICSGYPELDGVIQLFGMSQKVPSPRQSFPGFLQVELRV